MSEDKVPEIVSLGVLNVDFVMELGKDLIGKKRLGKRISISAGGYGGCQAIAAVRCGVSAAAVGRVGTDIFSYQIKKTLQEEHVDCQFLRETEGDNTGLSAIIAEEGKESVSIDFLGTNFKITNEDIDQCRSAIQRAKLVMIYMGPAVIEVAAHMVEVANQSRTPVLLTPTVFTGLQEGLWQKVDYLVMNLTQAADLCGLPEENTKTARIAAGMLSGQVKKAIVIHMDASGVLVAENGVLTTLDVMPESKVVDYSGATAFFTGVFGAELVKGSSVQKAAIKAHRAAMLCMAKVGTYASFPTIQQLKVL